MKKLIILRKNEGETPLEALEIFRRKHREYKGVKMTYAGRLDPLASGLLFVLAGDATREKEKYLKLSKEYDFEILFGFATDTYDILGQVCNSIILTNSRIEDLEKKIRKNLKFFRGEFVQSYPMYSSKPVSGRPLFAHARAGKQVKSPKHKVKVMSLKLLEMRTISWAKLLENIERRVGKVRGDFRQKEILKIWREKLGKEDRARFFTARFHLKCGSGTYVRAVANDLGKRIGVPSLALSIKRTKIGNWRQVG